MFYKNLSKYIYQILQFFILLLRNYNNNPDAFIINQIY
jgi:hypothetical protein